MRTASRWSSALTGVIAGLLVAACADSSSMPMHGQPSSRRAYHLHALSCSAPATLPGTTVHVMLADRGMSHVMMGTAPAGSRMVLHAVPAAVPAGQVSFVVANVGWRDHELVVLPLPPGTSAGHLVPGADETVDETGSLGEASASCQAGTGDHLRPGTVGWVTLTLSAGRYELVCNLPRHYAGGMNQLLVVS